MQSNQERLIHALSGFAYGEQFVFAPEEWPRGATAHREPADLVWSGNGCIILMYMKQMEERPDNPTRNEHKRDRGIRKNLGQASGALRYWRLGFPITGTNPFTSFSVDYRETLPVIVLSISESGCPIAQYHHAQTLNLGISMCATIPLSVLDSFAAMHAGIVDLIVFLMRLSNEQQGLNEHQAGELLDIYQIVALMRSGAFELRRGPAPDRYNYGVYDQAQRILRFARQAPHPGGTGSWMSFNRDGRLATWYAEEMGAVASVFADLLLSDYLLLWMNLLLCIDQARGERDVPPPFRQLPVGQDASVMRSVRLRHYDFILYVTAHIISLDRDLDRLPEFAQQASRHGANYIGPHLFIPLDSAPWAFAPQRPFPSYAELLLTQWRVSQDVPQRRADLLRFAQQWYTFA